MKTVISIILVLQLIGVFYANNELNKIRNITNNVTTRINAINTEVKKFQDKIKKLEEKVKKIKLPKTPRFEIKEKISV